MTAEQNQFLADKYHEKRKFLLEYAESSRHKYALAEEAVQQTFGIACYKINDFYNSPNPGGWLTKTLSFVIRNIHLCFPNITFSFTLIIAYLIKKLKYTSFTL